MIERAVALCTGPEIHREDLPDHVRESRHPVERVVDASGGPEVRRDAMPGSPAQAIALPHARPAAGLRESVTPSPDATLAQTKEEAEIQRITLAL